ncbi:MAG: C40 family peptidase [Chlamydiia bacterium]|nr:C40 family peptidase [Chlamydiia bacterium]
MHHLLTRYLFVLFALSSLLGEKIAAAEWVTRPVIEMREAPDRQSEIASQARCGEEITVIERRGEWTLIETVVDGYRGWVHDEGFYAVMPPKEESIWVFVNRPAAHVYGEEDTTHGPLCTLPFETPLRILNLPGDSSSRWITVILPDGRTASIQRGDITFSLGCKDFDEVAELSLRFLGLPYTWGGRSSFGYDCSGFVQMLYRQLGIAIPRDARDQMTWEGFKEIPLERMKRGDLVFFGPSSTHIVHVGMALDSERVIHPHITDLRPYLRIDSFAVENPFQWIGHPYVAVRRLILTPEAAAGPQQRHR